MSTPPLTARQQEVLAAIQRHIAEYGLPPTQAELAAALGIEHRIAVRDHLRALARKGAIEFREGVARGLRVLAEAASAPLNSLPLVGRIAAGVPVLAGDQVEDWVGVPADFFRPRADWLFRVHGESMLGIGVCDGDMVAIKDGHEARNGQIVAALVTQATTGEPELTLKRYRRSGETVTLLSENPDSERFPPQVYDLREQEVRVLGHYVGLLRQQVSP